MGKRKPLTVKEQTEQLRIIEERTVRASLRGLRLRLAKLQLKKLLEKSRKSTLKATKRKGQQRKEELRQIEEYVQAGNVEKCAPVLKQEKRRPYLSKGKLVIKKGCKASLQSVVS